MKILLTVHQFVPEWSAGTEILTFSTAKELLCRGHDVTVLTGFPVVQNPPDDQRIDYYEIEGVPVYRYSHTMLPTEEQPVVTELEYDNHLAARLFDQLLTQLQPDIVHFFHFARLGTGIIDVALTHNILTYYTPTDFWTICPTSQMLLPDFSMCKGPSDLAGNCSKHMFMLTHGEKTKQCLEKIPNRYPDVLPLLVKLKRLIKKNPLDVEILAMSKRHKVNVARINRLKHIFVPMQLMSTLLEANGVDKDLLSLTAFGIDISGYENVQIRSGKAKTIGFIGTLSEAKGCHVLIQAFKQLNLPDVQLKIYGNPDHYPDYAANLMALVDHHPAIEFCGTFPNQEIVSVLSELDALVVPSLWYENTPLVVHSALAARCPVIATNLGGLTEVVRDNDNGLLFEAGDSSGLAQCIALLTTSPDLLSRLSTNCKLPKSTVQYVNELELVYQKDFSEK